MIIHHLKCINVVNNVGKAANSKTDIVIDHNDYIHNFEGINYDDNSDDYYNFDRLFRKTQSIGPLEGYFTILINTNPSESSESCCFM